MKHSVAILFILGGIGFIAYQSPSVSNQKSLVLSATSDPHRLNKSLQGEMVIEKTETKGWLREALRNFNITNQQSLDEARVKLRDLIAADLNSTEAFVANLNSELHAHPIENLFLLLDSYLFVHPKPWSALTTFFSNDLQDINKDTHIYHHHITPHQKKSMAQAYILEKGFPKLRKRPLRTETMLSLKRLLEKQAEFSKDLMLVRESMTYLKSIFHLEDFELSRLVNSRNPSELFAFSDLLAADFHEENQ